QTEKDASGARNRAVHPMDNRRHGDAECRRRERQPVGNAPCAHVRPAGCRRNRKCTDPLNRDDGHEPAPIGSSGSQRFQIEALKFVYALPRLVRIASQAAAPANAMNAVSRTYSITSCPSVSTNNL